MHQADNNRNVVVVEEVGEGGEDEVGEGGEEEVEEVRRVGVLGLRSLPTVRSMEDKKLTAVILWVLKMVDSGFSYSSTDNLVPILQMMAPDSMVLKSIELKRNKAMYVLCYGLYPYFLNQLVSRIQKAPGFTLGTDSGTFKLHSLSKIVELDIRYGLNYRLQKI